VYFREIYVWPFFPRNSIPPFNPFLIHQFMFGQKGVKRRSDLLQFRANHGSIFTGGSHIYPLYNTYTFEEIFTKLYRPEYFLWSRQSLSSSRNFPPFTEQESLLLSSQQPPTKP
jgi:hypothetical protein